MVLASHNKYVYVVLFYHLTGEYLHNSEKGESNSKIIFMFLALDTFIPCHSKACHTKG